MVFQCVQFPTFPLPFPPTSTAVLITQVFPLHYHIRPQVGENRASRPISRTQAPNRLVSIAVGDHARILAVVCFFFLQVVGTGDWDPLDGMAGKDMGLRDREREQYVGLTS